MKRKPSHATVVAYLALFVALATGGAYAVERITSKQVQNNSLRSADLKDRKGVGGVDVKRDALAGKEVDEAALNASEFAPVAGVNDAGDCDPTLGRADRVRWAPGSHWIAGLAYSSWRRAGNTRGRRGRPVVRARVRRPSRRCPAPPTSRRPGEVSGTGTDDGATNGFARTLVTPDPLPAGEHEVALACWELEPDVRIETPTIAVIAISAG